MATERVIRIIAGFFVTISVALGYWVSPYWFLFTAFVGLNLLQSGFTRWCLMEDILKRAGIGRRRPRPEPVKLRVRDDDR